MDSTAIRCRAGLLVTAAAGALMVATMPTASARPSAPATASADRPGPAGPPVSTRAPAQANGVNSAATAALAQVNCAAGGPTAADAALAAELSPQIHTDRLAGVDAAQISCARVITNVAAANSLPSRAAVIAVTTAITESTLHDYTQAANLDSLGLFQQRPSQGWGTAQQVKDPVYATNKFLSVMEADFPGGRWQSGDIGVICQTVQVSAFPDEYDKQVAAAQLIVSSLATSSIPQTMRTPSVLSAPGRIDTFYRGADGNLWDKTYLKGWHVPTNLGSGPLGSAPVAVGQASGIIDVFWQGTDGGLWHDWYVNGAWHGPQSQGGSLASPPTAVQSAPGVVDVFYKGTDSSLWDKTYLNGTWRGPTNRGSGPLGSAPTAVAQTNGIIDVFWQGTDNGLWHDWYINGTWQGPQTLGGTLASEPTAVVQANGTIDVFYKRSDSTLGHEWYVVGLGWHGPETLGGQVS
jgi:hypothetical protein